jgi:hypothetical protein
VEQRSHSLEYVARRSRRRPHRLEPVRPGAAGRKLPRRSAFRITRAGWQWQ